MKTSKNVGELSSLTFLLKVIKGNYKPEHSQNTSGCEPNRETIMLICKSTWDLNKRFLNK